MTSDSHRATFDVSSLPSDRLQNLDIFRAVAALAVCLFHFQRESLTGGTLYEKIFQYGHYGVDIFLQGVWLEVLRFLKRLDKIKL